MIQSRMAKSGRGIVTISQDQVDNLAGNCYEVIGEDRRSKIIISTRSVTRGAPIIGIHTIHIICNRAWASLNKDQRSVLEGAGDVVTCNVDTIEMVGGGGIRCMMAGIFAKRK